MDLFSKKRAQLVAVLLCGAIAIGLCAAQQPQQEPQEPGPPKLKRGKPAPRPPSPLPKVEQPAAAETPDPSKSASPDPRAPLIEKARAFVEAYVGKLPNFICNQHTTRFISSGHGTNWEAQDVVTAALIYEDGVERYQNIKLSGRGGIKKMQQLPGAWSTGEFATVLRNVFEPSTEASFVHRGPSSMGGRSVVVYDFEVTQPRSRWRIFQGDQMLIPAYRGSVYVDQENAWVLYVEIEALDIPEDFPLDSARLLVEYGQVPLGTERFFLPTRAEIVSCVRDATTCARNVIDFRNYRRYSSKSEIFYEGVKK